jgi:capsular polysaccharide biosynthesis protein
VPAVDIYRAIWRHRTMIVLLTILAGVAAFAFTRQQPRIYEANALVRIQQRATTPAEAYGALGSLELGQRLAQTYATIVGTDAMRRRVARDLAGTVPSRDISISAKPVGDIELLQISARSERPTVTALVANATARSLGRFIKETGTLRDQIVVVDPAQVPKRPVSPRVVLTVVIVVLLALLFNSALALGREYFADRLPEVDDWAEKFERPVLATVPTLHLKSATDVLSPRPGRADAREPVPSAEALSGPTRWSVRTPEVGSRGD